MKKVDIITTDESIQISVNDNPYLVFPKNSLYIRPVKEGIDLVYTSNQKEYLHIPWGLLTLNNEPVTESNYRDSVKVFFSEKKTDGGDDTLTWSTFGDLSKAGSSIELEFEKITGKVTNLDGLNLTLEITSSEEIPKADIFRKLFMVNTTTTLSIENQTLNQVPVTISQSVGDSLSSEIIINIPGDITYLVNTYMTSDLKRCIGWVKKITYKK